VSSLLLLLCCAESSSSGLELQRRLFAEMSIVKESLMLPQVDGFGGKITIPIMEDLHLRKFPPLDSAHRHLDFARLRNSTGLSTEQQVICCFS